jgi:predicted O-methyltransferase YrrM
MLWRTVRRLPGAHRVRRQVQWAWDSVRPIPQPQYIPGTPMATADGIYPNPATLAAAAMSEDAAIAVGALLGKLTPGDESGMVHDFYRDARAKFGTHWRYADILTTLWAASTLTQPASYLEIGMLRGRSASVVGATCPGCSIYGFDLWIRDYYGEKETEGPDFVRRELESVGHRGDVTLISGDSTKTVPDFLRKHPDLYFDLITVDGDHSLMGAAFDLANTLPRLKVGGIVVFDDIRWARQLITVWDRLVRRDNRFASWEFTDAGLGVAAAIRTSDGQLFAPLE